MKTESELVGPLYLDAGGLVKIYLPEPESDRVDQLLRGRQDLLVSDLAVTEIVSAVARQHREGVLKAEVVRRLRGAILKDIESGVFLKIDMRPTIFREAERILMSVASVALRASDALHIGLALHGEAKSILTFDKRLAEAANTLGLQVWGGSGE